MRDSRADGAILTDSTVGRDAGRHTNSPGAKQSRGVMRQYRKQFLRLAGGYWCMPARGKFSVIAFERSEEHSLAAEGKLKDQLFTMSSLSLPRAARLTNLAATGLNGREIVSLECILVLRKV